MREKFNVPWADKSKNNGLTNSSERLSAEVSDHNTKEKNTTKTTRSVIQNPKVSKKVIFKQNSFKVPFKNVK